MINQSSDALTAASASALAAGASAQIIGANSERNGLSVSLSSLAAAPLFLLLGIGTASATNFHICIPAGNLWNGYVGGVQWRGAVQAFSSAAGQVGLAEV